MVRRQFRKRYGLATTLKGDKMGKKSGPDTEGAARAQGIANRETARDMTYADRPDQYNPFGSLKWTTKEAIDPATGESVTKWVQEQELSDSVQGLYDSTSGIMQSRNLLAGGLMGRMSDELGSAPNWDQFGDVVGMDYDPTQLRAAAEDAAYQRDTMRLDPQMASRQEQLEIKLRNQGLREGDQAYDSAMQSFGQDRADAYERARLGAASEGRTEAQQMYNQQKGSSEYANQLRQQQIQEYLGQRNYSLETINDLTANQGVADILSAFNG
jgi:hypothetical protein